MHSPSLVRRLAPFAFGSVLLACSSSGDGGPPPGVEASRADAIAACKATCGRNAACSKFTTFDLAGCETTCDGKAPALRADAAKVLLECRGLGCEDGIACVDKGLAALPETGAEARYCAAFAETAARLCPGAGLSCSRKLAPDNVVEGRIECAQKAKSCVTLVAGCQ